MSFARTVLEHLSRNVVLRRRLPSAFGGASLFVSPDASLRFWRRSLGSVDPELLRLADELVRPGEIVWDAGANVGLFAFAAAHRAGPVGRVLAIEADPSLAGLLQRSAEGLPLSYAPVSVRNIAVSEATGKALLAISARGRATNHLVSVAGSTQTGGARALFEVQAATLDRLLVEERPPSLVKIDVEGAELLALRGAERLLGDVRPRLLCETSVENTEAVGALLRGHDYVLLDAALPPGSRQSLPSPCWNTLAVPAEKWSA